MLKRNGQPCQRSVPDYSGRLTDFEFLAYNTVFRGVEDSYQELSLLSDSITHTERSFGDVLAVSSAPSEEGTHEVVAEKNGAKWAVIASLLKQRQNELLFCKKEGGGATEFAIVEKLAPNSPLAKAQGMWFVHQTSNDARLLLQDFIENERQTLNLYANDIVASAKERIEEKYPDEDMSRVIKAISARCTKKSVLEEKAIPFQHNRPARGVRI
jgi:hypothetical protein